MISFRSHTITNTIAFQVIALESTEIRTIRWKGGFTVGFDCKVVAVVIKEKYSNTSKVVSLGSVSTLVLKEYIQDKFPDN